MVATRRLKDEPDRLLMLGARLATRGERSGERGRTMLLFNPNHDGHTGEFTSGGGSGAGESESKGSSRTARAKASTKTTGGASKSKATTGQAKPRAARAASAATTAKGAASTKAEKPEKPASPTKGAKARATQSTEQNADTSAHATAEVKTPPVTGAVHSIPMESVHVGLNPREYFDKEGLAELASSIKENGLLQPISVRPHEGGYQIIAGERRFRAMQALGQTHVPAIVHNVGDEEAKRLAILENLNRADMKPTETGRAYKSLMDEHNMTAQDIARQFGKSEAHVQQHLDLVNSLEPHLQGLVDSGRLHMGVVRGLASLSRAGREEAAERILKGDLGLKSSQALIKTIHARENQMSLFGNPHLGHAATEAHDKYLDAMSKVTDALGKLDDATMEAMAPAIASPFKESERLGLMIKQLQRMQKILNITGHAMDAGGGGLSERGIVSPSRVMLATAISAALEAAYTLRELRLTKAGKPMSRVTLRLPDALQRVQRFDETGADGFHRSWIMLFPVGHYQHEQYGELDFTPDKLQKIKSQYDQRVRHIDAALDVDHRAAHDDSRATGWIESLQLRDRQPDGTPAGLWGCIKWTPYGLKFLNADEYRYFSPEFGPWDDPQTGEHFEDVLIGGALTNRPFLKTMPAIALADGGKDMPAISRKPWGSIKKSMLPRSAFLIPGDPKKKSTWRLPVYEGTGPLDADGCYTQRGPLNINGVKAAWAAVNGAHTGEDMTGVPASVIAKLKRWKAQYFPDDAKQASEASAGRRQGMEGRVSRKLGSLASVGSVDTDLLDDEDENDEGDESLTLADGGKPAKGSAAMKAKMAALRKKSSLNLGRGKNAASSSGKDAEDEEEDSEDSEEMAEDAEDERAEMAEEDDAETYDDSETYDDASDAEDEMLDDASDEDDDVDPEDNGGPEDEEENPPVGRKRGASKKSAKSKQATKQMMGARTAVSGGAHVRASEGYRRQGGEMNDGETISLAEAQQLREEVAQLRFRLYEEGIEKTLAGWRKGSFQFRENAKDAPKTGRIALSKGFSESYRAFMRSVGVRLSEADRNKVGALLEIALSSAVVDLSERGSSYDPEGRMVGASKRRAAGDDEKLQQVAERIALAEHGKDIAALTDEPAKVLAIYERASREVRY